MKTWMKVAAAVLLLVALVLGVTAFILPGMVERRTQQWLRKTTGRQLIVGTFSINPLTLTAEATGLRLTAPHRSKIVASVERARVSLSPLSLFRRALILSGARFDRPRLTLIRLPSGVLNLADLAASRRSGSRSSKPARYIVNNLVIADGAVDFIDRTRPGAPVHRLRSLNLRLPFFGTVSYLSDRYVTPLLSGVLDDAPFSLKGRLKPAPQAIEASVELDLHDLNLSRYAALIPHLPVRIKTGRVATTLKIAYRTSRSEPPTLKVAGQVTVTGLSIWDRTGAPAFDLPFAQTTILPSQILQRRLHLGPLLVYNLEVFVSRDRQGVWNHSRFARPGGGGAAPSRPFLVTVKQTRLRGGKIHFADARPPGGFRSEGKDIALDMGPYSTAGTTPVSFRLQLRTERGEGGDVQGTFTIRPLAVACTAQLTGLPLRPYYPYLASRITSPVSGTVDAGFRLEAGAVAGLKIEQGQVEIRDPAVAFAPGDGLRLARIALSGGAFDLKARSLAVGSITLEKGDLRFSRTSSGAWTPLALLARRRRPASSHPASEAPGPSWHYRIDTVRGGGWRVTFHDDMPKGKPVFSLADLDFSFTHLAGPEPTPSPFRVKATYGKKGRIALSGTVTQATRRLAMKTRLRRIHLPDFAAYLPSTVRIVLVDGNLDADLSLNANRKRGSARGDFQGRVGIRNFYCLDAAHREDLLKWGSLQIAHLQGSLAPFALHVGSVTLSDYYAKVLIDRRAKLNLLEAFAPGGKEPHSKTASGGKPGKRDIRIDAVTLQGGTVDFSDLHLIRPFATRMLKLGGSVGGLSAEATAPADVDLRGSLENQSPLSITGKINPLQKNLYANLKLNFSDIELIPFSPFTGTYLGYLVDKGKLSLTLQYLIDNHRLDAQNKVFLDQFTLGERVKSDQATSLPVRLAIALLKDRNGEIRLDLPVSGRTDDPQFNVWSVVLHILKNLLVKAATAPFSFLTSLFSGGEKDFSTVHFGYGSSRLPPPEQQKLARMAKALAERPGLSLEMAGYVDPRHDPEGYRKEQLRERVQRAKYLALLRQKELPAGTSEASITVGKTEYSRYLDAVYRKADFPKPRNFFGMLKSLPDEEKEKLLLTHIPAGSAQMEKLARARTAAVQSFLAGKGVARNRLFVVRSRVDAPRAKEGAGRSRVQLTVKAR